MNSDILRQRRNLISISIAISVYQLADGQLTKTSVFFGSILLGRPEVVLFLAWVALIYFLWRYWVYTRSKRQSTSYTRNGNCYVTDSDSYQFELQKFLANSEKYRKLSDFQLEASDVENKMEILNQYKKRSLPGTTPILVRGIFSRKLDYSLFIGLGANNYEGEHQISYQAQVGYFKIFPLELAAQVKTILLARSFSDYNLPYLFALLPFCIFLVKIIALNNN